MRARLGGLSTRALLVSGTVVILVYTTAAWFLVVSPARADTARLQGEVTAAELRLVEAQAAAHRPAGAGVPVADVLRLAKAMPGSDDQTGLLLELAGLARSTGVTMRSISPRAPEVVASGASAIPVTVTVGGSYFEISRFLARARGLVAYRRGTIRALGRLLTVESVELVESIGQGFPELDATITFNAFVYDGPITPPAGAEETDEAEPTGSAAAGSTS